MSDLLENYLQQFVAGVAGLVGESVRPRWQPEPPNIPDFATTWVATGIVNRRPIGIYGATIHDPTGIGQDLMLRHEEFDLVCSFYGPDCDTVASNLHDGLMIWQNKSELMLVGLAFVEIGESRRVPEFIKNQWIDRVDKVIVMRRIIQRYYPVRNVLSSQGIIYTDGLTDYQTQYNAPPA